MPGDHDLSAAAGIASLQATEATDTCLVCGGHSFQPMFSGSSHPRSVGENVTPTHYRITYSPRDLVHSIIRCRDCGLGMLPVQLRGNTSAAYIDGEDPSYLDQAEERIGNADRLLSLVPQGGHLLDVGCACGFLMLAARARGFDTYGIEPSAWASQYARSRFDLQVWQGMLEEVPLEPASYDVAVLADAIEHLGDPSAAVKKLHAILKPGGRLLILTPDLGSFAARIAGAHWWGLLDDHYHYFDRRTLRRFLEQNGFVVERIKSLGRAFPLRHWTYKLSQYSPRLERAAERTLHMLRLERLRVTINLGDQMACVGRKVDMDIGREK